MSPASRRAVGPIIAVCVVALGSVGLLVWSVQGVARRTIDTEGSGEADHLMCLSYCGTMELVEVRARFSAANIPQGIQCVCSAVTLIDRE